MPGFRGGDFGPRRRRPDAVGAGDPLGRRRLLPAGLSAAAVKIAGAPVWLHALDEPGVYVPD